MASLLDSTPGPARMAREEVAASQRVRMLRAMAEAVAEKGYANTVVADVTARAGVSRKTFYEHFAGKEACFLATFDASVAALREGMAAAPPLGPGVTAREHVHTMLSTYLRLLASEPAVAKANLVEVYAAGPEAAARRRASLERFAALLADTHARLREAGLATATPDRATYEHVVGAISSAVTIRVATGDAAGLPALAGELADFVVRVLDP